jgi:hypothetical protein
MSLFAILASSLIDEGFRVLMICSCSSLLGVRAFLNASKLVKLISGSLTDFSLSPLSIASLALTTLSRIPL